MIIINIVMFIILIIIISIASEQLIIRRMNLTEGVKIYKGSCVLDEGYGKLDNIKLDNTPSNILL